MKTVKSILCCLLMLVFGLQADAQTNEEPTFFIVSYMKVKPGMYGKYLAVEQGVWKKIHQERIKQGRLVNWWLYEVRFPAGTGTEYDFVTVNAVRGWNGVDSFSIGWNRVFQVLNKQEAALADSTEMFRDLVREELSYAADAIFKADANKNPSRYLIVNYMDVPDGKWEEYEAMETKLAKPLHEAQVKAGKRGGWGLYPLIFPGGSDRPYDAVTVDFYDKWEDIGGGDYEATLKQVHPGMSIEYFSRQIEATRRHVRGEVWILRDRAQ
ncbi:MAG: hypothetical protein IPH12_02790 [Saprospirales bacterium]|nr:hypothetical protein [Saprospirales bacterium]MBK8921439.1 hypothetical protein [Saprospirales bacterium]